MDLVEYPLLHYPDLMLAILKRASEGEATFQDCVEHLKGALEQAHEHPRIDPDEMFRRLSNARTYLAAAGLVEVGARDHFRITERGAAVLAANPKGVDDSVLMQFPEFRAFIRNSGEGPPPESPRTPEFEEGYAAHNAGKLPADNPYEFDTVKHLAWENGWFEARDG